MNYISIDGDDVGRKLASCYLSNDREGLTALSLALRHSMEAVAAALELRGFSVIFCAADGVVACADATTDLEETFEEVGRLAPVGITLSAGSGASLRESYIALISAKSNGKNCLHHYGMLDSRDGAS